MGLTSLHSKAPYNGRSKKAAYQVWLWMKHRCKSLKRVDAHRYAKRGITYCERWEEFENFFSDMGERPPGLTLERIDNEKGYSPENCKWATRKEQARNISTNRLLEHDGRTQSMAAWAEEAGLARDTFKHRIYKGMGIEEAMTRPLGRWPKAAGNR